MKVADVKYSQRIAYEKGHTFNTPEKRNTHSDRRHPKRKVIVINDNNKQTEIRGLKDLLNYMKI